MKKYFLSLLALSLLSLSACYGIPVQPVPAETALAMPQDARPSPVRLSQIRLAIPRGASIGSVSPRGFGILCRGPYGMVSRSAITSHIEKPALRDVFNDALAAQGYDISGSGTLMFDEDDDLARSLYLVGARITDIKMDVCQRVSFLFAYNLGYTGEAGIEVEWTVYDRLRRHTVYKTLTRGYTKMDLPNQEAVGLMLDDAFAAAANNLGASKDFHALLVQGIKPPSQPVSKEDLYGRAGMFNADDAVPTPLHPLLHDLHDTPAARDLDRLRRAAVLVASGAGHGYGVFISDQGHILTNAHVTGDADLVRVVTAGREYKLVGEVLRRDKERDVALIRLQDMPADLHPLVLPVRVTPPKIGEDVYAIGAPYHERDLQDTVTKGIVSAWRPSESMTRQSYIQSDVAIHPGNSGGPLLDGNGNLIGLSVAGYLNDDGGEAAGLNLFIPIGEALSKLDIPAPQSDR